MPVASCTTRIDAPVRTVAGLVRDVEVAAAAAARVGLGVSADRRLLIPGDEVRLVVDAAEPWRGTVRSVDGTGMTTVFDGGRLTHTVTEAAAGVRVELTWTGPDLPWVRRWLDAHAAELSRRAEEVAGGPVVVATALIRGARVLAAQRTRPPVLAGRWELPGGRVEAGESESDAVARECREELATGVRATGRLGTDLPIDAGVLRVHTAELLHGEPEPRALEHAALRWVGVDELAALDWVDADRAVVADLYRLLARPVVTGEACRDRR